MAHINLLPWREEERQKREKNFYITLGITFVVAAAVLYGAIMFVDGLIEEQNQRNAFLEKEIRLVDKKIKEIKDIERQKEQLLAQMQVIQELQESRPKIVKVLDSIAKIMPEGAHLTTLSRKSKLLQLDGLAQSNARVSVFMKAIDSNEEYGESNLKIVQKKSASDSEPRIFNIQVQEA
jgi:type IV pilus assembly protein PilN